MQKSWASNLMFLITEYCLKKKQPFQIWKFCTNVEGFFLGVYTQVRIEIHEWKDFYIWKGYMSILWPRDLVTENAMSTKFEELWITDSDHWIKLMYILEKNA
jgi:hypothetical protein